MSTRWTSSTTSLPRLSSNSALSFRRRDVSINREWIEYHVKKCDVVVPLVAIANPAQYVTDPLRVFELDFEANLEIVRAVREVPQAPHLSLDVRSVRNGRRIAVLDEEDEPVGVRPHPQAALDLRRLKQLLDRVIYAYGVEGGSSTTR